MQQGLKTLETAWLILNIRPRDRTHFAISHKSVKHHNFKNTSRVRPPKTCVKVEQDQENTRGVIMGWDDAFGVSVSGGISCQQAPAGVEHASQPVIRPWAHHVLQSWVWAERNTGQAHDSRDPTVPLLECEALGRKGKSCELLCFVLVCLFIPLFFLITSLLLLWWRCRVDAVLATTAIKADSLGVNKSPSHNRS